MRSYMATCLLIHAAMMICLNDGFPALLSNIMIFRAAEWCMICSRKDMSFTLMPALILQNILLQ